MSVFKTYREARIREASLREQRDQLSREILSKNERLAEAQSFEAASNAFYFDNGKFRSEPPSEQVVLQFRAALLADAIHEQEWQLSSKEATAVTRRLDAAWGEVCALEDAILDLDDPPAQFKERLVAARSVYKKWTDLVRSASDALSERDKLLKKLDAAIKDPACLPAVVIELWTLGHQAGLRYNHLSSACRAADQAWRLARIAFFEAVVRET